MLYSNRFSKRFSLPSVAGTNTAENRQVNPASKNSVVAPNTRADANIAITYPYLTLPETSFCLANRTAMNLAKSARILAQKPASQRAGMLQHYILLRKMPARYDNRMLKGFIPRNIVSLTAGY